MNYNHHHHHTTMNATSTTTESNNTCTPRTQHEQKMYKQHYEELKHLKSRLVEKEQEIQSLYPHLYSVEDASCVSFTSPLLVKKRRTGCVRSSSSTASSDDGDDVSSQQDTGEEKIHSTDLMSYFRSGRFLRSFVFGGLDGLTTTMVLVSSTSGMHQQDGNEVNVGAANSNSGGSSGGGEAAYLSTGAVFTLGMANAIADAFSMGMGDLLSSWADSDTAGSSLASKIDAIRNGIVMFVSFILFGFLPLTSYLSFFPYKTPTARYHSAWVFCVAGLFLLGVMKGAVTSSSGGGGGGSSVAAAGCSGSGAPSFLRYLEWYITHYRGLAKTGIVMVLTGGIASLLSLVISYFLHCETAPLSAPATPT